MIDSTYRLALLADMSLLRLSATATVTKLTLAPWAVQQKIGLVLFLTKGTKVSTVKATVHIFILEKHF